MKLSNLFESRRINTVPVEVEYEYEDDSGEDVEYHDVIFEIDVTITPDQYGTGDSPTGYDLDVRKAYYKETGKPFNWTKLLNKRERNWVEEKAVERALD